MTEPNPAPQKPGAGTPGDIDPTAAVRLVIPEGGYRRSKKPLLIGIVVIAAIAGFVVLIQNTVFAPTKLGTDFSAAENRLGDTHRVANLGDELLAAPGSTPCPTSVSQLNAADAAAFVSATDAALRAALDAQGYDTGVRGCYVGADGVKIETQIFRVGSATGALIVSEKQVSASIRGDDQTTPRGNVVVTGRSDPKGPLVTYVYGYRGVLVVTIRATPAAGATVDPAAIGALYDRQMDKIKSDEAQ
jgi:hypothetical protein